MSNNPGDTDYSPNIIVPDEEITSPRLRLETIRADIQNAINGGYSVEETIRGYRSVGLSFTDSNVRDIYHTVKGEMFALSLDSPDNVRFLSADSTIDDTQRQVLSWKSNDRYADVINLSVYDIQRGETRDILFRYYHNDESVTVQELIQRAMDTFNEPDTGTAQYLVATGGALAESFRSSDFI